MANQDHLLAAIDISKAFDHHSEQLCQSVGCERFARRGLKVRKTATRKVYGEYRGDVDKTGKERTELRSTPA